MLRESITKLVNMESSIELASISYKVKSTQRMFGVKKEFAKL